MKKIKVIILLAVLSVISALNANAQTGGPDVGGLWCYVNVDLKHDPTEMGYAYYLLPNSFPDGRTLNVSEGQEVNCCVGPGCPSLVGRDGETYLKLWLRDVERAFMLSENEEYATFYVDVNTETLVTVLGWWAHPVDVPKYYTIQLNVKNTDW